MPRARPGYLASCENRVVRPLLVCAAVALGSVAAPCAGRLVAGQPDTLRVFTTRAIATVLHEIRGDVERRLGLTLEITTDVAIRMVRRVHAGEPFDVLVAAPAQIDDLIAAGSLDLETRTNLARSGIGVAVRAGANRPDVSTVDAFKRALLAARSIAYLKEGQSGVYMAGVIDRLGIADAIRPKLTLPDTDIVSQLVSRGEVELGIVVITQILTTDGVALAGPLPPELQLYITFSGAVSARSRAPEAARELLRLLKQPEAIRVMRAQGMEPAESLQERLAEFEGRYEYRHGATLFMVASGERLMAIIGDGKYPLRVSGIDTFVNGSGDTIPFVRDAAGRIVAFKERGDTFARLSSTLPADTRGLLEPRPRGRTGVLPPTATLHPRSSRMGSASAPPGPARSPRESPNSSYVGSSTAHSGTSGRSPCTTRARCGSKSTFTATTAIVRIPCDR